MDRKEFNEFCGALASVTYVEQWGGASVWKVGGKIFAICANWGEGPGDKVKFKCSDLSYQILGELEGVSPAPYLARAKWVQVVPGATLTDEDVRSYIVDAHTIIARKLTKKYRAELGL